MAKKVKKEDLKHVFEKCCAESFGCLGTSYKLEEISFNSIYAECTIIKARETSRELNNEDIGAFNCKLKMYTRENCKATLIGSKLIISIDYEVID